jgi:hypothetical protein
VIAVGTSINGQPIKASAQGLAGIAAAVLVVAMFLAVYRN